MMNMRVLVLALCMAPIFEGATTEPAIKKAALTNQCSFKAIPDETPTEKNIKG
jgi:hypothetical protein